jgi:hypothetical protein
MQVAQHLPLFLVYFFCFLMNKGPTLLYVSGMGPWLRTINYHMNLNCKVESIT